MLPTPASGAHGGSGSSHVPQEFAQALFAHRRAHSENDAPCCCRCSPCTLLSNSGASPLWWAQASSQYTLSCHTLASSISHSQPQSSPWVCPPEPKLQHPVPAHTSGRVPGWGARGGGPDHLCRSSSILPTTSPLLCSPPRLRSSPSPG